MRILNEKNKLFLFIISISLLTVIFIPNVIGVNEIPVSNISKLKIPLGIDWWTTFHHDPQHIGLSTSYAPDNDNLLWAYQTDYFISSSPVVYHGKVFIGSWDKNLYCLNMTNGNMLWKYTTDGMITSTPTVYNNKVYIGSQDSNFYCLDTNNGNLIWSYETGFMIESSSTIKNNSIFFGSSDGSLYCLDLENGTKTWEYPSGNVILSSPAVTNDYVYFGNLNGEFFCLDKFSGEYIWSYQLTSGIWSSPSVHEEYVYFGSSDGFVYCLNKDNGNFIWSYDTAGEVHSSPAIAYGYVYIGATDKGIFCLNQDTGYLEWKFLISGGIWSSPSVADGKVYYGTYPCCGAPTYIHCNDAYNGESIWSENIGGLNGMKSSPAITVGRLFVGAGDGRVFAFGGNELIADAYGAYDGFSDQPLQFKSSAYWGFEEYSWLWEFGDGNTSIEKNPIHVYKNPGVYDVTLKITDSKGGIAIDNTNANVKLSNLPPESPTISGETKGKTGKELEYSISSEDPNGDKIRYLIDWGDNNTDITSFYESQEKIIKNHSWNEIGSFEIRVKAIDIHEAESNWSSLTVTMPKFKLYFHDFKLLNLINDFFLRILIDLKNLIDYLN